MIKVFHVLLIVNPHMSLLLISKKINSSLDVSANAPTFEYDGLSNRSAETDTVQRNSRYLGQYAIMGSKQTFPNASTRMHYINF